MEDTAKLYANAILEKLKGGATGQCSEVEAAKTMLPGLLGQRIHLDQEICNTDRVALIGTVAIWTWLLHNGVDAPSVAVALASALSSILIGLWRFYARYLDNAIAELYPSILYHETKLRVPAKYSLLSSMIKKWKTVEEVSERVKSGKVGTRGHQPFDVVALGLVLGLVAVVTLKYEGWRRLACCGVYIHFHQYVLLELHVVGFLLVVLAMNVFQTNAGGFPRVKSIWLWCVEHKLWGSFAFLVLNVVGVLLVILALNAVFQTDKTAVAFVRGFWLWCVELWGSLAFFLTGVRGLFFPV